MASSDSKQPAIPATTKAVYHESYGDVKEVLKMGPLPMPEPKDDQVLVKVVAAAINSIDWKMAQGFLASWWPLTFPHVYGFDAAGIVVKLGPQQNKIKIGDEVYFSNLGLGTFSEYAIAEPKQLAPKPASLSWEEAAGPIAYLTAYQMLAHRPFQPGTKILVLGASSSVGIAGVQIAKTWGAIVSATCSTRNMDLIKSLGADTVVDYTVGNWWEQFKAHEFDIVFDGAVGEGAYQHSQPIIKKGGLFVTAMLQAVAQDKSTADVELKPLACDVNKGSVDLVEMTKLFDAGKLKMIVDKVYPFELNAILEMTAYSATLRAKGKLVVRIAS